MYQGGTKSLRDYIQVGWSRLQAQTTLQRVRHGIAKRLGAYRKLHKLRLGQPGRMVCVREGAQRPHAGWPVTKQHGRLLRSKCGLNSTQRTSRQRSLRNWHSQKSSQPWAVVNPSIPSARYHLLQNGYSFDALQAYCFGINIKL